MNDGTGKPGPGQASPLRAAMRAARIEAAERSAVVVELRDAEAARLEILDEALGPVFADIPPEHLHQFDRGVSGGTQPRLWIDMVAHVAMGRDKRTYRFLQDTVHGRRVLAESTEVGPVVDAVTRYVARRIVAREQMLAATQAETPGARVAAALGLLRAWSRDPRFMMLLGIGIGAVLMLAALMLR